MPETIGQRLQQARLARQISLEKASEATRVRVVYLQALETDDYSAMSSAVQGRGFLRLYADFLGVNLDQAMTEMRQGGISPAPVEEIPPLVTADAPPAPEPLSAPPADDKPVRRGFWSRLLRRSTPEPSAEAGPAPEAEMPPAVIPEALPLPAESAPAPESPPTRPARAKAVAKKTKPPAKNGTPQEKPKTKPIPKPAGKKKQPLRSRSSR